VKAEDAPKDEGQRAHLQPAQLEIGDGRRVGFAEEKALLVLAFAVVVAVGAELLDAHVARLRLALGLDDLIRPLHFSLSDVPGGRLGRRRFCGR